MRVVEPRAPEPAAGRGAHLAVFDAQTLVAKAPVLLSQVDEAPTYRLFVRPSLVSYVVSWLADGMEGARAEPDRSHQLQSRP